MKSRFQALMIVVLAGFFLGAQRFPVFPFWSLQASDRVPTSANGHEKIFWEWVVVPNPVEEDYVVSCDFVSANDGWALGNKGGISHWDGNSWTPVPVKYDPNISTIKMKKIDMVSRDDGWAVGWQGIMLHWDGKQWKQFTSPIKADYYDVSMISGHFGFAGGAIISRQLPAEDPGMKMLLQWDGNQWTEVVLSERSTAKVGSILIVSDKEAWATSLSEFYHWNGKSWSNYDPQSETYRVIHDVLDMSANGPTDVWAVGTNAASEEDNGAIMHWDGTRWSKVMIDPHHLVAIRMFSPQQGWVIGHYFLTDQKKLPPDNVVLYWDGVRWSKVNVPTRYDLFTVCGSDPENVWIFGGKVMGEKGEMMPITLRLNQKILPTATVTATFIPTKTITPISMDTLSLTPSAAKTISKPVSDKKDSLGAMVVIIGGLFFLILAIFSLLLKLKNNK